MPAGESILVVHSDEPTVSAITRALQRAGYRVGARYDAREGLRALYDSPPDLVVIQKDMLLGESGPPYLGIREHVYVPLIAVGAEAGPGGVLEMGVDSYMRQPLSLRELVARVRAILRRKESYRRPRGDHDCSSVDADGLFCAASETLTGTELRLLSCLVLNAGGVLPYTRLVAEVWEEAVTRNTLHRSVRRIKQKLGIDSVGPYRLLNYPGEGYCFCANVPIAE